MKSRSALIETAILCYNNAKSYYGCIMHSAAIVSVQRLVILLAAILHVFITA